MKPFVIFPYQVENQHEIGILPHGGRDIHYLMQQTFSSDTPGAENPSLFFANDLQQAQMIAASIAAVNPGIQIMVASTTHMFSTPKLDPAKAVISKAKFTEAGLLPF